MSKIKSAEDIAILRALGKRHAFIVDELAAMVRPGVSTQALEERTLELILEKGDTPAFKNYRPQGAPRPFPSALCVALNDIVVHGIPTENPRILSEGDIIGLDIGLVREGRITDGGRTVAVGKIDAKAQLLLDVTQKALMLGIAQARAGNRVGDIGHAIETYVSTFGFGIVRDLCGHGVGHKVHEEPQIPNYGAAGVGMRLEAGMVLAIEPMINEGKAAVRFESDGYTVRTRDGSRSAHFEHTILVTDGVAEILTKR